FRTVLAPHQPDTVPSETSVCQPVSFVHRPEHRSHMYPGSSAPFIDCDFGPGGHGNRTDPTVLSDEIDNHPSAFTLLNMCEREGSGLGSPQLATDQDGK